MSGRRASASASARRVLVGALVPVLAGVLIAGCGLPTDDTVQRYDVGDLSPALANTTTTTTTTLPEPTVSSTPPPPLDTAPTTTVANDTAPVTVYYVLLSQNGLQAYTVTRARPVPRDSVVELLENPTGLSELRLRSSVRPGLIERTEMDRGVLTVHLNRSVLDRMAEADERRAIAQIVLTFTSFVTSDDGAIGSVRFEVDGQGYTVFVPLGGGQSEPGEALVFDDFKQLIATSSDRGPTATTEPATTTTTTVAGDTTAPVDDSPDTTNPAATATSVASEAPTRADG